MFFVDVVVVVRFQCKDSMIAIKDEDEEGEVKSEK